MKKINLIERLLSYSHEKQSPQRFARYAAMLIMLLTLGVGQMWASRTFTQGEKLYIRNQYCGNISANWDAAGAHIWVEFDGSAYSSDAVRVKGEANVAGSIYCVECPAGTYTNMQIKRGGSYKSVWNSTGNISINATKNFVWDGYDNGSTTANWTVNRYFNGAEKLFIQNIRPSDWGSGDVGWSQSADYRMYVYLCNGSSDPVWCNVTYEGSAEYGTSAVYSITPPQGNYKNIILLGNNQASFEKGKNDKYKTGDIELDPSQNYISGGFNPNKTAATWGSFTLNPITSDGTKRLYFKMNAINWWIRSSGNGNFAYFFGSGNTSSWSAHSVQAAGNYYYIVVPAGTWNGWILTRNSVTSNPSWNTKENQTADIFFRANKNYASLFYENGTAATWGQYAYTPAIILNQGEPDAYPMSLSEGTTYTKAINFSRHSTYEVQIIDGETVYGLNEMVASSSFSNYTIKSGEYRIRVATAGAGDYTFTYNRTGNKLSVTYPTVHHPSMDYCYVIKYDAWSSQKLHVWNSASGKASTSTASAGPQLYNPEEINGTNYFCIAPGDYGNFLVSDNGDGSKNTGDLTPSDGYGKYRWHNGTAWVWSSWNFTVTLTEQVTTTSAPSDPSVEFNGTALTSIASKPACDYYTFGGYYTAAGGGGSQLIDANKAWKASVSGYTDGSKKWIHEGGTAELFAKWTQSITLNQNGATTDGSTSLGATYNAVLDASGITNPSKDYYTFKGWANGTGGSGDVVIDENKDVKTVASWTDGSDKWIHNGASTLYAKWDEDTHSVTLANDGFGHVEIGSSTVTSVSGVGVATASSTITAVPNSGYQFVNWTGDFNDGVTIASGSTTSASITINATEDSKTITANFEPIVYDITLDDNGEYGGSGSAKVTFNTTALTDLIAPTRPGYHVDGYYREYDGKDWIDRVAEANGSLNASKTYTDASSHWTYAGDRTLITMWAANTITITLHRNDGSSTSTTTAVTMGGTDYTPAPSELTRAGYTFNGYYTAPTGGVQVFKKNGATNDEATDYIGSYSSWIWPEDVDLYAQWTPVALSFTNGAGDGSWSTASNWSPACVPTIEHDVTINAETTINGSAVAKSVTIGSSGKVTIQPTGVLEVAGTVTNTDADKLIINTTTSSQGALICDLTSAPTATVNMSIPSGGFHLIASPTGGVKVSSTFAGSGIYTYAWEEGKGWDRRGYYDDFMGNEAILIYGQTNCIFSGILSNACGGSTRYTAKPADASAQGINMLANPLTAPIRIADMTISNSEDGAVHLYNGSWVGKAPGSAGEAVIPAMQGYGVISKSGGGSVSFTYDTAVRGASSKNARLNAPKRTDSDILDHITLSVTTNDRKVDLELYENEQFTERIDVGWEAIYMEGDGRFGELYAIADEKMNILATPDLEGTVLGFVPGQAASYTISFEGDGKGYYLNDLDMQESTLIEEGNTYVFTPNESTNATRFVISKTPIHKTTTGNDAIYDGSKARKQMIDGILYIIRDGRIYDATGSLVK